MYRNTCVVVVEKRPQKNPQKKLKGKSDSGKIRMEHQRSFAIAVDLERKRDTDASERKGTSVGQRSVLSSLLPCFVLFLCYYSIYSIHFRA